MIREKLHKQIEAYLMLQGWVKHNSNYKGIDIFIETGNENPCEIAIPNNENISTYTELITNAVDTISDVFSINIHNTIKIIKGIDRDFHNYRLVDAQEDHIKLDLLYKIIECGRSIIKRSAVFEQSTIYKKLSKPEKHSVKNPYEQADEYLASCYFPHTWEGSFGLTIETPLWLPALSYLEEMQDTYGRKITKRILNGYSVIEKSVELGSPNYILDTIAPAEVLVFKDFQNMINDIKDNNIIMTIDISPTIKIEHEYQEKAKSTINYASISNIVKAVEQLSIEEEEIDVEIHGFPETLSATKEELMSDLFGETGTVIVHGTVINKRGIGSIKLKMQIKLEDYKKALRAQEIVRGVKVKCTIKKQIKGWHVLNVESFDLLD
jgi:hypothetical protein